MTSGVPVDAAACFREDPFDTMEGPHPSVVLAATAAESGFSVGELLGQRRSLPLVRWRHVAMAAARASSGWSYPALGRFFNRDHTTVINACQRVETSPSARVVRDRIVSHACLTTGIQLHLPGL